MLVFGLPSGRQIDLTAPVPEPVPDPDLETLPKISTDPDPDPKGDETSCARAHA